MRLRPLLLLLLLLLGMGRAWAGEAREGDWVCSKTYRSGEAFFWVTQILDRDGRPKARLASWRSPDGTELEWTFPVTGAWHDVPSEAWLQIRFERPPRQALSTRIYADGRLIDARERMSRRQARGNRRVSVIVLSVSFLPPDPVPQLHGVSELRMQAVAADGRLLAERILSLPPWKDADRFVAEGLREIEAMRADFRAKCLEQTGPEI